MTAGRLVLPLLRRLLMLLLTMAAVSFLVFLVLEVNIDSVAVKVLGQFSTPDQRADWLRENGYLDPFLLRYLRWLGRFVTGDWGVSTYYQEDVLTLILPRLAASALLAGGEGMRWQVLATPEEYSVRSSFTTCWGYACGVVCR